MFTPDFCSITLDKYSKSRAFNEEPFLSNKKRFQSFAYISLYNLYLKQLTFIIKKSNITFKEQQY